MIIDYVNNQYNRGANVINLADSWCFKECTRLMHMSVCRRAVQQQVLPCVVVSSTTTQYCSSSQRSGQLLMAAS